MLKLSTSYSKKIPVEGQDFSSQSFHAAVEVELSDSLQPAEINARIHDTFEMVKQAVEKELNGQVGQRLHAGVHPPQVRGSCRGFRQRLDPRETQGGLWAR